MDAVREFQIEMERAGLGPSSGEIIADGKLHRYHASGDSRGKENGWYILHDDERPAGRFGSWKTGETFSWTGKPAKKLTDRERKELERRISEQKKLAAEELERVRNETAARALEIWSSADPYNDGHGYLVAKQISGLGSRESRGNLVIPVRDETGKLWSLQFIYPDGTKKFLSGGRVEGCYSAIIADKLKPDSEFLICEGFATGATLHAATKLPVIVAFNAGNLMPVSRAIHAKYPKAKITLCADNDQWTERPVKNPGVHYAAHAAREIDGYLAIPEFMAEDLECGRATDFNDLQMLDGLERVREIVAAAHPAVIALQTDETADTTAPHANEDIPEAENPSVPSIEKPPVYPRFSHLSDKGKPLSTIQNVNDLLDAAGISVRYDVIRKDIDIQIPNSKFLVDTAKNDKMVSIISLAAFSRVPTQNVPEYVSFIAGQNPYNPVTDWITSKPWDGVARLPDFYATITAVGEDVDPMNRDFKELLLRKWCVSAVAAAFRPEGVSAHGVLVFRADQYVGKTAWFKSLVPAELKLISDGLSLNPDDKDSVFQVVTNWLVELGELDATFKKADIAKLKAFITRDRDTLRRPYARAESSFARRTVFFASVNDHDFLVDPTGNRRYWTIDVARINHAHGLDMQQVWAEVYELYKAGEGWYLSGDEMKVLNERNRDFSQVEPVEELVAKNLDWASPRTLWQKRTATEIAIMVGIDRPEAKHTRGVAKAVRELSGIPRIKSNGKSMYIVPGRAQDAIL